MSFTKNYTAGDVICVSHFANEEDKSKGTVRWLVCYEDLSSEIIAIPLTKNTSQIKNYPGAFIILKDSEEGRSMRLLYDSLVIPSRVARIKKQAAIKNGSCPEELMDKLSDVFKNINIPIEKL